MTSTSSSSSMYSSACSSVICRGGFRMMRLLRRGRAHVGQLLLAADVDRQVVVAAVLADDLALVDLLAAGDEQDAALLQVLQRVRRSPGRSRWRS